MQLKDFDCITLAVREAEGNQHSLMVLFTASGVGNVLVEAIRIRNRDLIMRLKFGSGLSDGSIPFQRLALILICLGRLNVHQLYTCWPS